MDTRDLPVGNISPQRNDRKVFDQGAIEGLAKSIELQGLLSPIRVRRKPDGSGFWLVAGERRWRAHLHLGRRTIAATVVDEDDRAAHRSMLAENAARVDLNVIEEARAYQRQVEEFGSTVLQVAEVAGREPGHIRWRLGLLTLAPDIVEEVARGSLRHTTAELMVGLDVNRQRAVLAVLARQELTWDEQRLLCQRLRNEQAEESLFDLDNFELVAEEYAAKARRDNRALSPKQLAALADEVVEGLMAVVDVVGALAPEQAAKVERLRGAIDYRLKREPR